MNTPSTEPLTAQSRLREIDRSMRWPLLLLLLSAIVWLLTATVFALLASVKSTHPGFLAWCEWLTYGHVWAAYLNSMIYGWGGNAIFGVGLWILARLCRRPVPQAGMLLIGAIFWNIAVTIGVGGIIIGDMTSIEWLEMPNYAVPLLAFSSIIMGIWGTLVVRYGRPGPVFISQLYMLGALFWFPWIYVTSQIFLIYDPARGVVQAMANWWYMHNLLGLWLIPAGLGAAYYLIPKILGRPIHSYYLASLGFWSLALIVGWGGMRHLAGGPMPAWFVTVGIVASMAMALPVAIAAINHHLTVSGRWEQVAASPVLRFVVFGTISYTLASLIGFAMSLRSVSEVSQFTLMLQGQTHHMIYAFFTMTMFGAIYYMMPRLLNCPWPSAKLIQCHFWCSAAGITLMLVALYAGGWIQGSQMNMATLDNYGNPVHLDFLQIAQNTMPWLHARTVSIFLLAVGHLALAAHILWMFALAALSCKKAFYATNNHNLLPETAAS